jgi:hypothetical protein
MPRPYGRVGSSPTWGTIITTGRCRGENPAGMSEETSKYRLPGRVEQLLGTLSTLYAQEGERLLQEIVVNAQTRTELWSSDGWNGGTYGHALFLTVPESVFVASLKRKDEFRERIRKDLNHIDSLQNESFDDVFIEMEVTPDSQWRQKSGLLLTSKRVVAPDATKRIWEEGKFRLFLSHKSEVKKDVHDLKERLRPFGISSFVAHDDIHPTKTWQDEIENALASMDGFVAILTEKFHESDWTDQEVGYAFARGVPIIAVRLGRDPYGFIGKFQGLSSSWQNAPEDMARILIKNDRMFGAYIGALYECRSFDDGNVLARALPGIEALSEQQIDELVAAYNANGEIRGAFGFNGHKSGQYGPGLLWYLHQFGARKFGIDRDRHIKEANALSSEGL